MRTDYSTEDKPEPEYSNSDWKMIQVADSRTGQVYSDYMEGSFVDEMIFKGLTEHERHNTCMYQYGRLVCVAPKTQMQDCVYVPLIDSTTGTVIETKTVC